MGSSGRFYAGLATLMIIVGGALGLAWEFLLYLGSLVGL